MASSIVASAAQQLGALVAGQGKYLYEVSDKIERLQEDLQWMQCFLEDADNRQHKEKVVAIWVSKIRDFAYEAEEIVEKYLCRVSRRRKEGKWNTIKWLSCVPCDAQALYEVGSNIDCLRTRMSELASRMQMFGIQMTSQSESLAYNNVVREQRRTYAHIEEDVVGLEEDIKKVVDELVNSTSKSKVVGLWGMGGLGKTTLARRVFQDDGVRKHFKKSVWVYISKQFDRKDIYREILTGLENIDNGEEKTRKNEEKPDRVDRRKKIKELSDGDLQKEIRKILKEKECLVILDDLWRDVDWDTLNPAFDGIKSSCSKILITTRNKSLVNHAEKDGYLHALRCLSEKESWKLLQRTLFPGNENIEKWKTTEEIAGESSTLQVNKIDQTNLQDEDVKAKEKLAKEMLKHCNGLPLAIKALGGLLSTKRTITEWENVQRNIASYLMSDIVEGTDNKELSSVLELSYSDLPFYLKPCFLYLGIFPEDYKISAERLYHLWEAEGLVTASAYGGDEILGVRLDDIAESFLNQLVNRSMVQVEEISSSNGRIKSCRLHDMMRDLCLKKCKEVNFVNILEQGGSEGPSNQIASLSAANRKLRRCAIYLRGSGSVVDTTLSNDNSPCIRSLVIFPQGDYDGRKLLSGETRKAMSLVRVLDLEGTVIQVSRPVKFGNFIHLRYLSIKGTPTYYSPSGIWDCKYLETLDLRVFGYMKLSNQFWKLERLRHLYLPRLMELMGSKKQLILKTNQLQQMETFKNFNVGFCKNEDLEKMTNMRVFTLHEWCYLDGGSLKCLLESPMMTAKRLVRPFRLQIQASVINEDPTMLTTRGSDLCIGGIGIDGLIDVELDDSVQIFPNNLTSVKLDGCKIGEQGIRMLEKLPLLKKLDLIFDGIKVSKMSFSKGGFTQLVQLVLQYLDTLEELEVEEGALPNLRYLKICDCRNLKRIPEGLHTSIQIECYPCVEGIEFYKTCRHFIQSD